MGSTRSPTILTIPVSESLQMPQRLKLKLRTRLFFDLGDSLRRECKMWEDRQVLPGPGIPVMASTQEPFHSPKDPH